MYVVIKDKHLKMIIETLFLFSIMLLVSGFQNSKCLMLK